MALWHTLRVPLTARERITTMSEQGAATAQSSRNVVSAAAVGTRGLQRHALNSRSASLICLTRFGYNGRA
jgi:hypothetical protein